METQAGPENASGTSAAPVSWVSRAFAWCEARYGLDLRSLAVFRVGLGALLLADLVDRARDLRAHYTDVGVLTREHLVTGLGRPASYSLHMVSGDTVSQVLLFAVAGVSASMLLLGYRTRLASIVSWVLLCSLQNRNPLVLQSGDDLLRLMLFWSMFVPLGARFSVDAVLAEQTPPLRSRLLSLGTLALATQLFTMYVVSATRQTGPSWHQDGTALQLVLHHQALATACGQWLRDLSPRVLQGLTWQVWWLERYGPLLFFVPWKTFWWRTLAAAAFVTFHIGSLVTLELGLLPWVAIVCWLVVLPSWFWDGPAYRLALGTKHYSSLSELSQRAQALIVRHRKWWGPPLPPARIRPTWFGSVLVLVCAGAAAYGSGDATRRGDHVISERLAALQRLGLSANWGLFVPDPPTTSGWLVSVAEQQGGAEIDVWNGGRAVTFEPPSVPSATYRSQRWRHLMQNVVPGSHARVNNVLRWLCREWNEDRSELERVQSITLYQLAQTANSEAAGYGPISKYHVARESCPTGP